MNGLEQIFPLIVGVALFALIFSRLFVLTASATLKHFTPVIKEPEKAVEMEPIKPTTMEELMRDCETDVRSRV